MDDKQAKSLALLLIDEMSGPARAVWVNLEAARMALEIDEPDVAQKFMSRAMSAADELQTACNGLESLARHKGYER